MLLDEPAEIQKPNQNEDRGNTFIDRANEPSADAEVGGRVTTNVMIKDPALDPTRRGGWKLEVVADGLRWRYPFQWHRQTQS